MANVIYSLAASSESCLWLAARQEKVGARMRDRQAARQKATEGQDASMKSAVDKATSELRSAPSASEELSKQYAEELRDQDDRLIAKHHEVFEKAVKAATDKAQESAPTLAAAPIAEAQKAVIDAAVAAAQVAKDAEPRTKHQVEIEKAVESGRLEGTMMKLRLKDTQLVRAQKEVKEFEAQIEEWRKTRVIPGD